MLPHWKRCLTAAFSLDYLVGQVQRNTASSIPLWIKSRVGILFHLNQVAGNE